MSVVVSEIRIAVRDEQCRRELSIQRGYDSREYSDYQSKAVNS